MEEKKTKKKILTIIIILIIIIVGGVGGYYIYQNYENNKSVGTSWGDKYHMYLKNTMADTQSDRNTKYGIPNNIEDTKIQFIETVENEPPKMAMTYKLDGKEYVNIYYINANDTVEYMAYKQPSTLQLLYNIELKEYIWYVNIEEGNNHSYKTVGSKSDNTATEVEENAEYTFTEEEMKIGDNTKVAEGEIPTISKFEETFVVPEIEEGKTSIELNSNVGNKVLREAIKGAVESYKPKEKIVTDEVKNQIEESVTKLETKKEEIKKDEEEQKKKEEEEAADVAKKVIEKNVEGLTVKNFNFKYGTYTFLMPNGGDNGETLEGTIVLKPNGVFHITSNFTEGSFSSNESMDCDGTYKVKLDVYSWPADEYLDGIEFTPSIGEKFFFTAYSNNEFGDEWHGYTYSGS